MMSLWPKIQEILAPQLEPGLLKVWIQPLLASFDGATLQLTAPGEFIAGRVRERFLPLIHAAARDILGREAHVEISVAEAKPIALSEKRCSAAPAVLHPGQKGATAPATQASLPMQRPNARKNWNYTFETFVVGPSNALAHAAAHELCREKLTTDTLFLCSAPGLGKTHLMQAMGQALESAASQGKRVEYLSAEDFANSMVAAIKSREMPRFKARFREVDVLLLEDVHFLQNKEYTQDELLATINALKARGSRLILSSSFAPKDLKKIDSQLFSRFCSGLVAPIELPSFEMRCRLFSEKARLLHQVLLPDEITELLARHIHADIRQIESCLHNLTLKARLLNHAISADMALDVIRAYAEREVVMDFDGILRTVCRGFNLTPDHLNSRSRKREYVLARNTVFYLARKHTDMSLEEIGGRLNRTHTTVIKGIASLEREIGQGTPLGGEIARTLGLVEQNGRLDFA